MQCVLLALLFGLSSTKVDIVFAFNRYIAVECLRNGLQITLKPNDLRRQAKGLMKLILNDKVIGITNKKCEMDVQLSQTVSFLAPEICLVNNTMQKVSLVIGNQTIHEFAFSCDGEPDVILSAVHNGERLGINSSVQIGFELILVASSQRLPFRIVDCWTEHDNHRTSFLENGIPVRDSRADPLCQLSEGIAALDYDSGGNNTGNYDNDGRDFNNQKWKFWQIQLRLSWDTLPDSRQKALQQLLRTRPQLQWEAVPDLSVVTVNFSSPITIYPIMIQCSVSPFLSNRTSTFASFGPIGIFIPQFYFLENTLFSCCPIETTVAYASLLQRAAQKRRFCWKVSVAAALSVSFSAFIAATCCTALAFHICGRK